MKLIQRFFPELKKFPREYDRDYAWQAATESSMKSNSYQRYLTGQMIALFLSSMLLIGWKGSAYQGIREAIVGVAVILPIVFVIRSTRRNITRSLREQLNKSGFPICVRCGYDLRGTAENRCSECGTPISPEGA